MELENNVPCVEASLRTTPSNIIPGMGITGSEANRSAPSVRCSRNNSKNERIRQYTSTTVDSRQADSCSSGLHVDSNLLKRTATSSSSSCAEVMTYSLREYVPVKRGPCR